MNKLGHVMLDLETMGTGPSAAIVSIGAIAFDPITGEMGAEFYTTVDLGSSVMWGGVKDEDTVAWWAKQSATARDALMVNTLSIEEALRLFNKFVLDHTTEGGGFKLWGNGSDFDNVILGSAYRNLSMTPPWKFYNNRCYRTMKSLFPTVLIKRVGTFHNALDDAKSQAEHLVRINAKVG